MQAVTVAEDRAFRVPADHRVRVARVAAHRVRLQPHSVMAVGNVDGPWRRLLNNGDDDLWPPVTGTWTTDPDGAAFFEVRDGRHEVVASLMRARRELLVAWAEPLEAGPQPYEPLIPCGLVRP